MSLKSKLKTLLEAYSKTDNVSWKGVTYRVDWHQERDNADVTVTDYHTDETIFDSYDPEEISGLIEDGFFKWEDSDSLIKYLDSIGQLKSITGRYERGKAAGMEEGEQNMSKELRMAEIVDIVGTHVDQAFAECQNKVGITSGDIEPMMEMKVVEAIGMIANVIETQLRQNKPGYWDDTK